MKIRKKNHKKIKNIQKMLETENTQKFKNMTPKKLVMKP